MMQLSSCGCLFVNLSQYRRGRQASPVGGPALLSTTKEDLEPDALARVEKSQSLDRCQSLDRYRGRGVPKRPIIGIESRVWAANVGQSEVCGPPLASSVAKFRPRQSTPATWPKALQNSVISRTDVLEVAISIFYS